MIGRLIRGSILLALLWCLSAQPSLGRSLQGRHYLGGWTRTTQYNLCCITASGRSVYWGAVAAPYWIPLYAHVVIPGLHKTFLVLDRGLLGDNQIDIWVPYYPYGIKDYYQGVYWY